MNIEQFEPIIKLIHKTFYPMQPYESYKAYVEKSETNRQLLFSTNIDIVEPVDDFKIKPTLYQVFLDLDNIELIFEIGHYEVANEICTLLEITEVFKRDKVHLITQPNPENISKYLKAYRLLNPEATIGANVDLEKIMEAALEGRDVKGRYYEHKDDKYSYLEVVSSTEFKEIICDSSDHLVYAITEGGNLGNESIDINKKIYKTVNRRILSLTKIFNREVLMTLFSIEEGIEDYDELTKRVIALNVPTE